ncbi:MAG: Gfo/Idh/MocA family oxidoreductase [Candidatus Hydrogenedentes bacterium]|nr:Gfo/Idh/MocA family oxidoreductase [Candidatus Hydrogenedentota bacterium]
MMNRRRFLAGCAGAGIASTFSINVLGANERVVIGIMGIHDRGMDLAREIVGRSDVELRYLADPDTRLFKKRADLVAGSTGLRPKCVTDYREILDDSEVDGLCIATPDHWHALATIHACQAGKDVYVEKPTAHSIWESRKMVEAARKYDRVVQVGTQNRSATYCEQARERVNAADFGDIHFVRIINAKQRGTIGRKADVPTPKGLDYDLWLGPASKRPFNENRFHYNWHWFWDYSGGDVINDGIHQIDLARWLTGRTLPSAVSSVGGQHVFDDDRETPDTQTINWEFDGLNMTLDQTLWSPYMKKHPFALRDEEDLPNWPFAGTRIEVYGTKQFMYLGRMGGGWQIFDSDGKTVGIQPGKFSPSNTKHMANFIDSMRTRKRPNADIEEGHYSTLLGHYGNIAYRTGRRLHIDPITEGFVDDAEANGFVRRAYRKPYVVPEEV